MSPEKEYGAAEYLCYEVVRQMEDRDRDVPETDFNKFCSLVYEEVTGEDVDMPLPIYWYEYETSSIQTTSAILFSHMSGHGGDPTGGIKLQPETFQMTRLK